MSFFIYIYETFPRQEDTLQDKHDPESIEEQDSIRVYANLTGEEIMRKLKSVNESKKKRFKWFRKHDPESIEEQDSIRVYVDAETDYYQMSAQKKLVSVKFSLSKTS